MTAAAGAPGVSSAVVSRRPAAGVMPSDVEVVSRHRLRVRGIGLPVDRQAGAIEVGEREHVDLAGKLRAAISSKALQ